MHDIVLLSERINFQITVKDWVDSWGRYNINAMTELSPNWETRLSDRILIHNVCVSMCQIIIDSSGKEISQILMKEVHVPIYTVFDDQLAASKVGIRNCFIAAE